MQASKMPSTDKKMSGWRLRVDGPGIKLSKAQWLQLAQVSLPYLSQDAIQQLFGACNMATGNNSYLMKGKFQECLVKSDQPKALVTQGRSGLPAAAPPAPAQQGGVQRGVKWWVWVLVGLGVLIFGIIIIAVVILARKKIEVKKIDWWLEGWEVGTGHGGFRYDIIIPSDF
uniref:Uncharacterized protein n=1 Tax=Eutreptiella gymnastica TaxID=73025 RepID=A0A7S1J2Q6_9EUGL|mmetsp:Transcript_62049/g.110552  ORF Transcript_62049/g.110552 Transcript_62049/m.110552 type:complete len:171 (+) Transcript_62049:489-1001(+)